MVSDLGGGNRGLHKELGITLENPWFYNCCNKEKVFVFADTPHLLKLIRNHFLDHGFIYNGKEVNKCIIEKLLSFSNKDLRITYKISQENLNVIGPARQKVKLAAKLFSHTISAAISWCGENGYYEDENWRECAELFKHVGNKEAHL